jgi:hypothetical protein
VTDRGTARTSAWLRLAAALTVVASIAVLFALPAFEHRPAHAGLVNALLRFDRSLPLVGLGLAFAQASRRQICVSAVLLLVGGSVGCLAGARLAAMIEEDFTVAAYLFVAGPLQCVVVGIALLTPPGLRAASLPFAAAVSGLVLGVGAVADVPGAFGTEYLAGAALAALSLMLVPSLLLREVRWPGLAVVTRIAGSWLTAIGLMLLALELRGTQGWG